MSQQSVNSETTTEEKSTLWPGVITLSPAVEFLLLFGLTLVAALSLAVIF